MRPLDQVLADSRKSAMLDRLCGQGTCQICDGLRRELEKWEANLCWDIRNDQRETSPIKAKLAEVRALLGRTDGHAPTPLGYFGPKPPQISQATATQLMEACEAMVAAMIRYEMDVDMDSTHEHRKMMSHAKAVIDDARADLAGEAPQ